MKSLRDWLRPRQPGSAEIAKERLRLVLVHDQVDMTPELLDTLKGELLAVLSRHFEIDHAGLMVEVVRSDRRYKLVANIPIKRKKQ